MASEGRQVTPQVLQTELKHRLGHEFVAMVSVGDAVEAGSKQLVTKSHVERHSWQLLLVGVFASGKNACQKRTKNGWLCSKK